eukprot:NODE_9281_length_606_cov_17.144928_g8648_i0.p1 GENE.NODE_9281_length_606_cov_17.144928_g8648_i0~~NODE_9281_length_606_cov_17.144928_g8648_i0.p1  ORF type:complete len:124 (-),score=34.36 NODE_9281_length_606_cov_17.144928_g8648_i0:177-548(-)
MSSLRPLTLYRQLLKSQLKLFGKDYEMVIKGYNHTRDEFEKNRSITDPKELQKLLELASYTVKTLEEGLVQGYKDEDGLGRVRIKSDQVNDQEPIELLTMKETREFMEKGGKKPPARIRCDDP